MENWFDQYKGMGGTQAVDAYGKNMAAAAGQGAYGFGDSGLKGIQSYMKDYLPYDKKFMGYVDGLGTDAYRSQQRGQAMAGVQQQADSARQQQARKLAAMGINPNSGAYATANAALNGQLALGKVGAAMAADRGARDEWAKGLTTIGAMGERAAGIAQKSGMVGTDLAKVGLAAADLGATARDRETNAAANATSASASAINASTNAAKVAQDASQFDRSFDYKIGRDKVGDSQWDKSYGLSLGRLALDTNKFTADSLFNDKALAAKISAGKIDWGDALAGAGLRYAFTPDGMKAIGNVWDRLTAPSSTPSSVIPADGVFTGGTQSNDDIWKMINGEES